MFVCVKITDLDNPSLILHWLQVNSLIHWLCSYSVVMLIQCSSIWSIEDVWLKMFDDASVRVVNGSNMSMWVPQDLFRMLWICVPWISGLHNTSIKICLSSMALGKGTDIIIKYVRCMTSWLLPVHLSYGQIIDTNPQKVCLFVQPFKIQTPKEDQTKEIC